MRRDSPQADRFFPIEEAPVLVSVTHKGVARDVRVPHKKALIAADTGDIVGIVGAGYTVFTNQQAVTLCHKFCLEAFPDTNPAEWTFVEGHGPGTRSWAAMDIHHRSHAMNLMGNGGPSETFTPFVRITLREEFRKTLAGIRSVGINPVEARKLVRLVTGWPQLPEKPSPWENDEQAKLDTDLEGRLSSYFQELGENAYAAFNTLTDIASRPPQSPRFRRDRPTLERRAGAWLRDFRIAASRPGFAVASHLDSLSKSAAAGSFPHR